MSLIDLSMLSAPVLTGASKDDAKNELVFTWSNNTTTKLSLGTSVTKVDADTAKTSDVVVKFAVNSQALSAPLVDNAATVAIELVREAGYSALVSLTAEIATNVPLVFANGTKSFTGTFKGNALILSVKVEDGATLPVAGSSLPVTLTAANAERSRRATLAVVV